jgi:RimJ/RimL family protein N-acetyltransferase
VGTHTMRSLERLSASNESGWAFYYEWEKRVLAARATLSPWMSDAAMIDHLRKHWIQGDLVLGAWVVLDDFERPIAHAAGWVAIEWGVPIIFIFQVVADEGFQITDFAEEFLADLKQWRERINAAYEKAGSTLRVAKIRFCTERDSQWMRYLRDKWPATRILTILEVT